MAPEAGRLEDVRRIAVLKPGAIGDFVFTLPALAALRAAYPQARITLLGKAWQAQFLHGRPGPIDEVLVLPPVPGVGADPDAPCADACIEACLAELRDRRFDLALQLHGGGGYSNPFVRRLGARVCVGARAPEAAALDRWIPYDCWRNERLRALEIAALAGAPSVEWDPRLAVTDADVAALAAAFGTLPDAPLVVLQPGATDPRRRWPAERFAAVGDALAAAGAALVVNGSADEAALTAEVVAAMRAPALDASGLPLTALAALLARARLLVANDTGPLHLAQAIGTPTIGLYWATNLLTAEPLVAGPHRWRLARSMDCPVCGVPNVALRCPHDASFVQEIALDDVRALALARYAELAVS